MCENLRRWLLLVLLLSVGPARSDQPTLPDPKHFALIEKLEGLEPWESGTYSQSGWDRLVALAQLVQRTDPNEVSAALDAFLQRHHQQREPWEETKPYLLLRVVFDLPEDAPAAKVRYFDGFLTHRLNVVAGQRSTNPLLMFDQRFSIVAGQRRVNLAWPITWGGGRPRLLAVAIASIRPYKAVDEFKYFQSHFSMRNLSRYQNASDHRD
jgi:hypothetical protein